MHYNTHPRGLQFFTYLGAPKDVGNASLLLIKYRCRATIWPEVLH